MLLILIRITLKYFLNRSNYMELYGGGDFLKGPNKVYTNLQPIRLTQNL